MEGAVPFAPHRIGRPPCAGEEFERCQEEKIMPKQVLELPFSELWGYIDEASLPFDHKGLLEVPKEKMLLPTRTICPLRGVAVRGKDFLGIY
jgi:hypothetical protein